MSVPLTAPPQPAAKGSATAGGFASLVCFLDGLLLLGVAVTQIAGGGFGILVGLWNIGVTVAYMIVAWGLSARRTWSYGAGIGLGIVNIGFVFFQVQLVGLGATAGVISESAAVIPLLFLAGDIVLVVTLFALKNAIIPPPPAAEVPVPPALLAELDHALAQRQISVHEKDLLVATYQAFVAKTQGSRSLQIETDVELGGERVDIKVYRMLDAMLVSGSCEPTADRGRVLIQFQPTAHRRG